MQVERIRLNSKMRYWYNTSLSRPIHTHNITYNIYLYIVYIYIYVHFIFGDYLLMMSDRQRCRSRYRVFAAAVIVIPLIIRTNEMRPPPTKRIMHVNRKIIPPRCICTRPPSKGSNRRERVTSSGRAGLRWSVL